MGWFRVYDQMAYERKLQRIARDLGLPFMQVVGAWTLILCMANESPIRGKLMHTETFPERSIDVSGTFQCTEDETFRLLDAFIKADMVTFEDDIYSVVNWDKRQFKSDISTQRTRKLRDAEREGTDLKRSGNGVGNNKQKRSGNAPETEYRIHKHNTEGKGGTGGNINPNDLTPLQWDLLAILEDIKDYPYDFDADITHIRRLAKAYPTLNLVIVYEDYADWTLKNPIQGGNPRGRLRTFCRKALERQQSDKPSLAFPSQTEPQYEPLDAKGLDRLIEEAEKQAEEAANA